MADETIVKLDAWIDSQVDEMAALETLLTSYPAIAPDSGGTGEAKKCAALEEWLKAQGLRDIKHYDAPDDRVPGGLRPNILVTLPGQEARAVWSIGHLDVVPEGDAGLWHGDPWVVRRESDRLIGRGVEDNQQGILAGAFAALAFLKNGITPKYTIKLLFAADEEVGSAYGVNYLLAKHPDLFGGALKNGDLIIVPDGGGGPTGSDMEVAEKNILWLRVALHGKQSHGSRPNQGCNAHLAGCALALALHDMGALFAAEDPLFDPPYSTFEPTKKDANVPNINTIPGEDVFYMDCRILPQYSLALVREEVKKRAAEVGKKYGVTVDLREEQSGESPATPKDAPVVQALGAQIRRVYGVTPRPVGIGGGTVAAGLRRLGLNAVVWHRDTGSAHSPNEYCLLESLLGDTKVIAGVMAG